MKKFLSYVLQAKTNACYIFTAILFFYAIGDVFGYASPLSGFLILEVMVLALICGTFQVLIFSNLIFKRMREACRTLLLGVVLLVTVTGFGLLFHWFPADQAAGWLSFLAIFLLAFVGLTMAFEIIFRITGRRYTSLLEEKQQKGGKEGA